MDATVASWRRQQRTRLIAARKAATPEQRKAATAIIAGRLDHIIAALSCPVVGVYWPINHELNLLPWARALARRAGTTLCLPVVVTPKSPLEYWHWIPGEPMQPGFWKIPAPVRREPLSPDLVLAPLIGFDRDNYRLGYGGGYFDRTLGASEPRPIAVGIGYEFGSLDSIFPQSHDIPMQAILTEQRDTSPEAWSTHAA